METKLLPLFPLNLVVYPGEKLNLHIFEPRYRQLISEAIARETTFGIPAFINNEVGIFGTEMRVVSVERYYPEGEMDVTTQGLRVFEIKHFFNTMQNRLYAGGEVLLHEDNSRPDVLAELTIKQLIDQMYETLRIKKTFPDYSTYSIAHHIGFDIEQEYAVLQLPNEYERQQFVLEHLREIVPKVIEIERLKLKVQMNGYFKNFKPLDF